MMTKKFEKYELLTFFYLALQISAPNLFLFTCLSIKTELAPRSIFIVKKKKSQFTFVSLITLTSLCLDIPFLTKREELFSEQNFIHLTLIVGQFLILKLFFFYAYYITWLHVSSGFHLKKKSSFPKRIRTKIASVQNFFTVDRKR